MTPTQPTADEVASAATRLIVFANELYGAGSDGANKMVADINTLHTHSAKLRAENEGLKSQNAVMVEAVKTAVFNLVGERGELGRTDEARIYNSQLALQTLAKALADSPTTPNAFDRVRELEDALKPFAAMHREGCDPNEVACERGHYSDATIIYSKDFEKAQQTLNKAE